MFQYLNKLSGYYKKELEILYVLYIVIDDNNRWYYGTINSMVLKYRNVQI